MALGQDVLAGGQSSRGTVQVAEAPTSLPAGGGLKSSGQGSYRAASAALAPAGNSSSATGGKGVMDVDGPRGGSGGGHKSGRKTILNYGSGGGGRGGSPQHTPKDR